jgi:SAM-dependent methyltransferase
MGLDRRYVDLVLRLLRRSPRSDGRSPRMFEIGYGCGALLAEVSAAGFGVAGIEVSSTMRDQALPLVPPDFHGQLLHGDFLQREFDEQEAFDVVYWNDVFEHVPPDEIGDYLEQAARLLRPGGALVTITPNWHERPSDVTCDFCPPRTEARGLHLKEYTLREVTAMLRGTGFRRITTPLVVLPHKIYLGLGGLAPLKRACEPLLEHLPFWLTHRLCHGFGYSYTIAEKA